MPLDPAAIYFTVDPILCRHEFLRFRRTHRRPRIAKKWRRFGVINKPCPGVGYRLAGMHCLCPHAADALDRHIKSRNRT